MICCSSEAELIEAAKECTAQDYEERKPFIELNCSRALDFVDVHVNSARVLEFDSRYGVDGLAATSGP